MVDHLSGHERDYPPLDYSRLYDFRFKDVDQHAREAVWRVISPFVWERMGRPRRILDPAGGRGEFIKTVPAEERWFVDAVDYPAREIGADTRVLIGDIMDVDLPSGYFDGVFASNLLEHLSSAEAVAAFLARMRDVLVPGGVLAVMGPNFKFCMRDYFDCADHVLPLTHVSVQELLFAAQFEVTESVDRFLPFSFRSRLPASPGLTSLYLRLPLLWKLQGKQFLVVARR